MSEPLVGVLVDPEPPQSFMRRPKHLRWLNPDYLAWVKRTPANAARCLQMIHIT
jgi:hypothetical protein